MILTDMKQLLRDTIYASRKTHKEIGELLGITQNSVSLIIGRQSPDALTPTTVKLAEVLGYDIEVKFVRHKK